MKKFIIALMLMTSTMIMAGGDVAPVEAPVEVQVADKDFYVGVGVTAVQTYENGQSNWFEDDNNAETGYGFGLTVGYVAYRAGSFETSVEGRVNQTAWNYFNDDFEFNDDSNLLTYSALIKPTYYFGDYGVYGLGGYGASKLSLGNTTARENGFVYGGGVSYAVTDTYDVTIDYVVNPAFSENGFSDVENDVITLGVNYKF